MNSGVAVSDFITPHYYDVLAIPGNRYSFTGAIKGPRQILPGGYISWVDPLKDEWQQLMYVDPSKPPSIQNLGPADARKSLREWIDGLAASHSSHQSSRTIDNDKQKKLFEYSTERIAALDRISVAKAKFYK